MTSRHQRGRPRGSVIAIVLAVIALASFLLAAFVERSTTELLVETRAAQASRLRAAAHSGLEAALAVVASYQAEDGGLFAPAQGWGDPLGSADLAPAPGVRVRVLDESGRPSLPRLSPAQVASLLEELGLRRDQADRVAEALGVWTRQAQGSARLETEARQYQLADPPHHAPGRPLGSFEELAAVAVAREHFFDDEGRPTELLRRFAAEVSLHDFPATNLNTATPRAWDLAGLAPADVTRVQAWFATEKGRRGAPPRFFRDANEARSLLGTVPPGFETRARILRVVVVAREGPAELRLEAVVAPAAGDSAGQGDRASSSPLGYPFSLLDLDESLVLDAPAA
ncbi:MAG TPA: hypothetical protein VEB66_00245 [Opitutaceae bacterium]|nr:hypothetical protein [Opitutaceae bacterium]